MTTKPHTNARKLPQQDRSKVTVEAILIAAAHILIESGYNSASTNRIAQRAGVSIGSLYQYFPNKEAIVTALRQQHVDEMLKIIEAALHQFASHSLAGSFHSRFWQRV